MLLTVNSVKNGNKNDVLFDKFYKFSKYNLNVLSNIFLISNKNNDFHYVIID